MRCFVIFNNYYLNLLHKIFALKTTFDHCMPSMYSEMQASFANDRQSSSVLYFSKSLWNVVLLPEIFENSMHRILASVTCKILTHISTSSLISSFNSSLPALINFILYLFLLTHGSIFSFLR